MRRRRRNGRHRSVWKHRFIKDDMTSYKELISGKRYTSYIDLHIPEKCKWKFLAEVCECCKALVEENTHNQRSSNE